MDMPVAFVVFKALLGFGLPIAIGIQQLVATKRLIREDRARAAATAAEPVAGAATAATAPTSGVRELEPA